MCRLNRAPLALILAAFLWTGSAGDAQAQEQLFGVEGASGAASTLHEFVSATGLPTGPGPFAILDPFLVPLTHVVAIDFHPVTQVLYGIVNVGKLGDLVFPHDSKLITIDATSGAATVIGTIGPNAAFADLTQPVTLPGDCDTHFTDMSFDPLPPHDLHAWRPCTQQLYNSGLGRHRGAGRPCPLQ